MFDSLPASRLPLSGSTAPERFKARMRNCYTATVPRVGSDCLLWPGSITGPGYGDLYFGTRSNGKKIAITAHVLAWRMAHGGAIVPAGRVVMHECDVRICCNEDHLELGTHAQNIEAVRRRGSMFTQWRESGLVLVRRGGILDRGKRIVAINEGREKPAAEILTGPGGLFRPTDAALPRRLNA